MICVILFGKFKKKFFRKVFSTLPEIEPLLIHPRERIVYSLVPPPFVRLLPPVMPLCEDEVFY